MQEGNDPSLGVNSWLEEELYHQYRFDRKSVDEGWTDLFVHERSIFKHLSDIGPDGCEADACRLHLASVHLGSGNDRSVPAMPQLNGYCEIRMEIA